MMRKVILIVTAAGLGRRIKEYSLEKYGRYIDKPLVELRNKSLLAWSIKPFFPLITSGILKFSDIYIIIRTDQDVNAFKEAAKSINPNVQVIQIEKLTKGPAHTAYEASKKISVIKSIEDYSIIVSDSDHTFRCDSLVSYFRDTNKDRFNSFCTLNTVSNPEKWGYIIRDENGFFLSGEKDISNRKSNDAEKAEFLIGCYIYHDLSTLGMGLKEFESSIHNNKESHHSIVLSLLSRKFNVDTIKSNWGMGLGTPLQLENAENSIISYEGNREPPTYIIDIDGVIFKHDAGKFSNTGDFKENPSSILDNLQTINKLYKEGSTIILCSSRPESSYEKTNQDLINLGLNYNKLILGATSGIRYLINDRKPSNLALNTAISINTIRDEKLDIDKNGKIDFIKDCSKGSGASTLILRDQTNNHTFVRKWTSSSNEAVTKTLYRQFSYLRLMSKYVDYAVPDILDWGFSSRGISYYDMSYIDGPPLSFDMLNNSNISISNLCNILSSLYESSSKNSSFKSYRNLLNSITHERLNPTIYQCRETLSDTFKLYEPILPDDFIYKLIRGVERITEDNELWISHKPSLIHGDLTFENIFMVNSSLFLIDPLGSTMDVHMNGSMQQCTSPIFDLGKLFQSIISQYEQWAYLDLNAIDIYIRNFSVAEEKIKISESLNSINEITTFFNQYINGNIIKDGLFSLAQILIRVSPYRVRAKYHHSALICLLKAYSIIEYLEEC